MKTPGSSSILSPLITAYVALHQALGKGFDGEHRILRALDHWLTETWS
jgi:hypothetical protein